jgi:hypothetical protein
VIAVPVGLIALLLLWSPLLRRTYGTYIRNLFGATLIARRGKLIEVSDGVRYLDRSFTTAVAEVESIEVRADGFGLVVKRGGLLDIIECFEFGKLLSIRKKLFLVRALGKLLGDGPLKPGRVNAPDAAIASTRSL